MKPLTGPMNQLNWTRKKGLNISEQPLSILASVLTAPLNQIYTVSESSSHLRILPTNWHHKQPLSGPKANFIGQPDTLGCSVFRCGAAQVLLMAHGYRTSLICLPLIGSRSEKAITPSEDCYSPPLLKALQPKLNWLIIARLSKVNRYADALETGADGKTDLVDTYRGWAWLPRIGEMFLTMNLRMLSVFSGWFAIAVNAGEASQADSKQEKKVRYLRSMKALSLVTCHPLNTFPVRHGARTDISRSGVPTV